MSFHTEMEGLKSEVKKERAHSCHRDTHIAYKLYARLGNICDVVAELLYVCNAMVGGIGVVELGPLFGVCGPIELTTVNYATADNGSVSVHILCCGMNDDIASVLKGTAEEGGREGIVNNEGDAVLMSDSRKAVKIENVECGICDSLAEEHTGVFIDQRLNLLVAHSRGSKSYLYAEALESNGKEIDGATVDSGERNDILSRLGDIENCEKDSGHTRGGKDRARTALEIGDLLLYLSNRGVGDTRVHMAVSLEVEEVADFFRGAVLISSALIYRQNAGFAVTGVVTRLYAFCFDLVIRHFYPHFRAEAQTKLIQYNYLARTTIRKAPKIKAPGLIRIILVTLIIPQRRHKFNR